MSPQRRTALVSIGAAAALVALKLGTGLASGSLGLLSEALHSGTDLVAALLTLFAVVLSQMVLVGFLAAAAPDLNAAVVGVQRRISQLQAQGLRPLAAMQRRETYTRDGAVTAASWAGLAMAYRARASPTTASRPGT